MKDKKWKVLFKRLPDETVIDSLMPVIAQSENRARELALFGLTFSNLKNDAVTDIEIVSCTEIV